MCRLNIYALTTSLQFRYQLLLSVLAELIYTALKQQSPGKCKSSYVLRYSLLFHYVLFNSITTYRRSQRNVSKLFIRSPFHNFIFFLVNRCSSNSKPTACRLIISVYSFARSAAQCFCMLIWKCQFTDHLTIQASMERPSKSEPTTQNCWERESVCLPWHEGECSIGPSKSRC